MAAIKLCIMTVMVELLVSTEAGAKPSPDIARAGSPAAQSSLPEQNPSAMVVLGGTSMSRC